MNIGCVILASGASRRFGSNKLLAPFLGKPLVCRVLEQVPCELAQCLVVTRDESVAELAREAGLEVLLHDLPDKADTIWLGVQRMTDMAGCLFMVADQPLCTAETMRRLITEFQRFPGAIVRAAFGEQAGNPVLFPADLFGELAALQQGQSGGAVIRRHAGRVRLVQAGSSAELVDVDTPESLEMLQRIALKL